jgi:hypothetical protein
MMLRLAAGVLLLILPSAVHAQEPTPLEAAMLTCIAPGFIPDGDPYELIASLPEKNCIRACKATARGCKSVVRTIDRCGVSFLRATANTAIEICRGLGGTSRKCREIRNVIKPDIDWWRAAGKWEIADCVAEMQTSCLSRCQSVTPLSVMPPIVAPEPPQGGAGVTIVVFPGIERTLIPLAPETTQFGVHDQVLNVTEYLQLIPADPDPSQEGPIDPVGGIINYLVLPE